jgi:HSP20 family molecular chaperone IbpA
MKCSCGQNLDKSWEFCPHCGKKVEKGFRLELPNFGFNKKEESFEDMDSDMDEQMEEMNRKAEQMLNAFGIPGKINIKIIRHGPEGFAPVQVQSAPKIRRTEAKPQEEVPKPVEETAEPITKITKSAGGMKIVMQLPGVLSPDDIKIRQFGESIEVKAYAGKRCYFKVIPVRPNSEIVEKKLTDEMLKLVVKS